MQFIPDRFVEAIQLPSDPTGDAALSRLTLKAVPQPHRVEHIASRILLGVLHLSRIERRINSWSVIVPEFTTNLFVRSEPLAPIKIDLTKPTTLLQPGQSRIGR